MLVVLTGPSGAGKTTLAYELEKQGFTMLKSHTTRPSANHYAAEYNYVTDEEYDATEFIEKVEYAGYRYGVSKAEFEKVIGAEDDFVVVTEIHGALQLRTAAPGDVFIVFVDAPNAMLERRLVERGRGNVEIRMARVAKDRSDGIPHCNLFVRNMDGDDIAEKARLIARRAKRWSSTW